MESMHSTPKLPMLRKTKSSTPKLVHTIKEKEAPNSSWEARVTLTSNKKKKEGKNCITPVLLMNTDTETITSVLLMNTDTETIVYRDCDGNSWLST